MPAHRLKSQLRFVRQVDRLKLVLRKGKIFSRGRLENSAEHSWHLAVMVMVLHAYAKIRINVGRAVQIAIVHDLAEILVGDTIVYDTKARARKARLEPRAAARLFGMLGGAQGAAFMKLWREYEDASSPEARFVRVVDRLEPLMANYANKGYSWKKFGISAAQIRALHDSWAGDAPVLGAYANDLITRAIRRGYLKPQ